MKVLAGDIGGTKTLLQAARFTPGGALKGEVVAEKRFDSRAYADLAPVIRAFLLEHALDPAEFVGCCFGVAGPVLETGNGQRAALTNLPWRLNSTRLEQELGLTRVRLINDFQAVGYGIEALGREDLDPLQDLPAQPRAPRVVLGAGTGLGVGILCWRDGYYEAYPTEGGHMAFAPTDAVQDRLMGALRAEFGRVSYERVLSGPGLEAIYRFLLEDRGAEDRAGLLQQPDPPAAISTHGLTRGDPLATTALDLFVQIYGSLAGDLALMTLATGGIFIAGGIAPKILPRLHSGPFGAAFRNKGRMGALVQAMPVHVVINPAVGLLGALRAATRLQPPQTVSGVDR